mgnify:CR=1 FL=1
MSFRVDLNIFRGPLDLLLFLVRKHEIETPEIPIALITEQFLEYLTVLESLWLNPLVRLILLRVFRTLGLLVLRLSL